MSDIKDIMNKFIALGKWPGKAKMAEYASILADLIRVRTRLGYGAKTEGGPKGKFRELSKAYKKQRKKKGVASTTSANKSNLTNTGKMLDSLKGKGTGETTGEVYIADKQREEVAGYHETGTDKMPSRPFMHVDAATKKKLTDSIRRDLIKQLRKK